MFWNYANSKLKTRERILDLFTQGGTQTLTTDDTEKANVLSNFFASVFTKEPVDELPTTSTKNVVYPMEELQVDEKCVEKILQNLRPSKSPGTDGLHPRVLKELSGILATPLTMIFKSSFFGYEFNTRKLEDSQYHPIVQKR